MLTGMTKSFRPYDLQQQLLFPPSLQDWVPEDHLARFISDVVDSLDLSAIYASYDAKDARGARPYHPAMLVKLLVYGYCAGVASSRRIERATYDDVAFRFLSADQHPDHDSIAEFRKRHLKALAGLFLQVLKLCQKAGLVKLGHVALDGTKVKANASKHKAMSYDRMLKAEQHLKDEIQSLLNEAQRTDAAEDAKYGKGKRGDELPDELARRESRLKKIQEAKAALEQEAKERAEREAEEAREKNAEREKKRGTPDGKRMGQPFKEPDPAKAVPEPKAQRNFTDPDSRIMLDGATKGFVQAYNAQVAVDGACQIIVAADVTQQAVDNGQLVPMLGLVQANLGVLPEKVSADAGYFSEANVTADLLDGVELFIPPNQRESSDAQPGGQGRPKNKAALAMREKLASEVGKDVYRMRKAIVEPVFGQAKEARGFRRFVLRGIEKVRDEWRLICLGHNLLKLFRAGVPLPA
jgi:transposase